MDELTIQFSRQGDNVTAEIKDLNLYGISTSHVEALDELLLNLRYFVGYYGSLPKNQCVGDALRLKTLFAHLDWAPHDD